ALPRGAVTLEPCPLHDERPPEVHLRRHGREGVVEERDRHRQHHQREADAKQADGRKHLPALEDLPRDLEVAGQHRLILVFSAYAAGLRDYITCRPSNSRMMRWVRSAFCRSCVTITMVVPSSFRL